MILEIKERYQPIYLFDDLLIESEIIRIYLSQFGIEPNNIKNRFLRSCIKESNPELRKMLLSYKKTWSIKEIEELFYSLIDKQQIESKGIIFTPNYIVDYILSETIDKYEKPTICDFSCGCGAFLIRAIERIISKDPSQSVIDLIENNIFGVDILEENTRRTKILLSLLAVREGEDKEQINFNILCHDSTESGIIEKFDNERILDGFDCVVGNPPYIKIQDLPVEARKKLKNNFKTTTLGSINIYFAFIELGMRYLNQKGTLGYIVPNYFLKMKSAQPLRDFLIKNTFIKKVIDFKDCQLFNNVQTYSAIITLTKENKDGFEYEIVHKLDSYDLSKLNNSLKYLKYRDVNVETINLLNNTDKENIFKIENAGYKLKISTGIATQKDDLYIIGLKDGESIDEDTEYYYIKYNDELYPIEKEVTVPLIKGGTNIDHDTGRVKKKARIIYPYYRDNNGVIRVIPEHILREKYPKTYEYFEIIREELAKRNGGNPQVSVWYEYGRSQALDSFGPKIISPTNSDKPKFTLFEEWALFNNGYAIYGVKSSSPPSISLKALTKVLNSVVMDYYIKLTSYMISGGYYCYQKKYIKDFSIPYFTEEEIKYLEITTDQDEIDKFLINKYGLCL
jgi:adenine-specific DNA-methyltransferase